jgi:hypothetical protein
MFESHRINVMITPGPKLGGTGECHMVLATPVSVSCGGGGISASESLHSASESESEASALTGSSGAIWSSATAGVTLTPSESRILASEFQYES